MPFEDVLVSYERGFVGDYSRDVGLSSAIPSNRSRSGERPPKKLHFNEKSNDAADASGAMVSLIQSNYEGFGSGIVVPGTGIALNNRGSGFVLEPGHPNQVAPRKRPFHTIIPGFATQDGAPVAAFGVMGGAMQPQGHVQVGTRMFALGQNPQAAIDAPRWRVEAETLMVEAAWGEDFRRGLTARGHVLEENPPLQFGAAQVIWRLPAGGYVAASESRRDGQ